MMAILILVGVFFILLLICNTTNNKLTYSNALMLFITAISFLTLIIKWLMFPLSATLIIFPILLLIIIYYRKKINFNQIALKQYLITLIISFGLLYFINNSFFGLDLNSFENLNSHFNTFINTYYFNNLSTNLIDYFYIDILHLLFNTTEPTQIIQNYANIALFTFYFIFITFIFECINATQTITHNVIYILTFTLYFVSLPSIAYNYLNSLWLIIPISFLYQGVDNVKVSPLNILISLLFGIIINPSLFLISIIILLCINKKTPIIYKLIFTIGLSILTSIHNPTSVLNIFNILLSNEHNTLLPLFYINRKQIVITIVFLAVLVINIFNTKDSSVKASNFFTVLLFLTLLISKNSNMLYILMLVIVNPFNFVLQINQFVTLTLDSFINVNNVPIALALLSIWTVSYSINFNPFELTNKAEKSSFLNEEEYEIIEYVSKNYSIDTSINSELSCINSFMPIIDNGDKASVLITKANKKEAVENYSLVFKTENYFVYQLMN